jgi:gluconate 2-dehydrogenase gamma chain
MDGSTWDKSERFFDDHQRQTIAAAMARIIPSDDTPGAREAGTIDFLDRYLSGTDFIFAKPDGSGFETLAGKQVAAWRGRIAALREKYVAGIAELDRVSRDLHGDHFCRLTEEQQDAVLARLERPAHRQEAEIAAEAAIAASEPALQQTAAETELPFFPLLVLHTRQGFYADPIYGGNRDHAGWQAIGFPGPDSLAETHAGRYTTLPYFAPGAADTGKEAGGDGEAQA